MDGDTSLLVQLDGEPCAAPHLVLSCNVAVLIELRGTELLPSNALLLDLKREDI